MSPRLFRIGLAAVIALAGLALPRSTEHAEAQLSQQTTGTNEIQYFNTSLQAVRLDNENWKDAFNSMVEHGYRPDIIAVLEVPWERTNHGNVADADRDSVLNHIEQTFGEVTGTPEYEYAHVDALNNACKTATAGAECGNTMIVFRGARFVQLGVLRWGGLKDEKTDTSPECDQVNPNVDQIAVSLRDQLQLKTVVAAALHLPTDAPKECVAPNLKAMNDKVEFNFSNRPMTIVSGDFNEHPDPRHTNNELKAEWRPEKSLACWYKRLSQYHADDGCSITVGAEFSFPYYDAIATHHPSGGEAICSQWTFGNTDTTDRGANPCTLVKKRIDFVWVRYEKASTGTAITPSPGNSDFARAQIASAGTDDGLHGGIVYSDHRMLQARFLWCGLTLEPTPCTP